MTFKLQRYEERPATIQEHRELRDEIKRLRAALESLTKDPPATLDEPDTDAEVIIKMRKIAKNALNIHHHSEKHDG